MVDDEMVTWLMMVDGWLINRSQREVANNTDPVNLIQTGKR